jgi:predicted RNase H-like nuclease
MGETLVTIVIGIDCATDPRKVGLAKGTVSGSRLSLEAVTSGGRTRPVAKIVAEWASGSQRTLLALDAPLGWPRSMGRHLAEHRAGQFVPASANNMFRRTTDRVVKTRIGRQPLDVGADRIARTAHAALELIHELRELLSQPIPLTLSASFREPLAAIEVYPAGTLTAYGFRASRYKERTQETERKEIVRSLSGQMKIRAGESQVLARNADVLAATVCLLAARDFLVGKVIPPEDPELAELEGWIWVKDPD